MLITDAKWSCHGDEAQTAVALEAAGCVVLVHAGQLSHLYRDPWRICERNGVKRLKIDARGLGLKCKELPL